ncbi:MAG: hypothetical protein ACK504_12065 [Bacteroidota bacterium]
MIEFLRSKRRQLKHILGTYPIYKVTKRLKEKNLLNDIIALEVFSNSGEHQAPAYYKYAKYFEAWEISNYWEPFLKKNLPKAIIKITDSFKEVYASDKKFNFIIMDAHMGIFGDKNQYCEHFEILPIIFRRCMDNCTLIFNVMPYCENKWKKKYDTVFRKDHLQRREKFYNCEDPNNVSYQFMEKFYTNLCELNGFNVEWMFFEKRHLLHYCVIRINKKTS